MSETNDLPVPIPEKDESALVRSGLEESYEWVIETYSEAVREKYRFFSYGDAMLIT